MYVALIVSPTALSHKEKLWVQRNYIVVVGVCKIILILFVYASLNEVACTKGYEMLTFFL